MARQPSRYATDRFEDAALRFVNHIRQRAHLTPVQVLEAGVPWDLALSPVGRSTGLSFSEMWGDQLIVAIGHGRCWRFRLGPGIQEFCARFDEMAYPHLVDASLWAAQIVGEIPAAPSSRGWSDLGHLYEAPATAKIETIADAAQAFLAEVRGV